MTTAEFLKILEKDSEVKFTGSTLRAPTFRMRDLLCATLKAVLPEAELIRYGVQTSTFPEAAWTGQLAWLLVLRAHLLKMTCTARLDEKGEDATAFFIATRIDPIDGALRIESTLEYPALPATMRASSAGARVSLGDATFDIKSDCRLLTELGMGGFIAALLEAAVYSTSRESPA